MIHPEENIIILRFPRRIIMSESITNQQREQFTPHASLAALAACLQARGIFEAVRNGVPIVQKTVIDSPRTSSSIFW
jgi:hypothetical protein